MSDPPNSAPDDRRAARNRLLGRALLVGLGLLLAIYAAAMFLPRRT